MGKESGSFRVVGLVGTSFLLPCLLGMPSKSMDKDDAAVCQKVFAQYILIRRTLASLREDPPAP
jgi:hypothetical protein